jgi:hypothetical protein
MGWERRKGSRKAYYTWTLTVGGRRKRIYLGPAGDPVAELAAAYDALDRVSVELDRRARAEEADMPDRVRIEQAIIAATTSLGAMMASGGRPLPPPDEREDAGTSSERLD